MMNVPSACAQRKNLRLVDVGTARTAAGAAIILKTIAGILKITCKAMNNNSTTYRNGDDE
jgi:hypothetical protein